MCCNAITTSELNRPELKPELSEVISMYACMVVECLSVIRNKNKYYKQGKLCNAIETHTYTSNQAGSSPPSYLHGSKDTRPSGSSLNPHIQKGAEGPLLLIDLAHIKGPAPLLHGLNLPSYLLHPLVNVVQL